MRSFWHCFGLVSAVICLLLAAHGTPIEAQSGLLLGLSRSCDEKSCDPPNRTLWIAQQDGKLQIMELPDLIVPRKTGFWRVGTRLYCDPHELKTDPHKEPSPTGAIFAAPVNQRPTVYGVAQCPAHVQYLDTEGVCGDNVPYGAKGINVLFVNDEYISLDDWWTSDCGAHPDYGGRQTVERFGAPARRPIAYGEIEGKLASNDYEWKAADALLENASRIFDDGSRMPYGEGNTDEDKEIRENFPKWSNMSKLDKVTVMQTLNDGCFPKHDDREWGIERNHGQWVAYGSFDTHRLCGVLVHFELPLHAKFAAPSPGPISPDSIKKQITANAVSDSEARKGVIDAIWSPNHEFAVVFADMDWLHVYSPHGQDLGKPIISVRLKEAENLVMSEAATGNNVARWTAELKKIKAQGVVKPLLSSSPHP